ncbi:GntR family transcriptional regulator [Ancylobacter sp. MQZ15Z-1]|uniref:GntR family transcriptional regulator n=1 Tax=Ancylobacter mangrovi TaxID=2972472 RepID=A0A9X2PJ37_9HYPH|nr:GntR family transcriptional regulator [Ancylobacter mangrovi]MCS0497178.1 GntR family transcriptional regulator [Ancylobacter mangrovi]
MIKPSKKDNSPGSALMARPASLVDNVYDVLLGQLMTLQIQPGERLRVDNLSRELGVSQTPVREALSRLEVNGLVIKTHLVGYRAAPQLTKSQFEELFDFRLLLEPTAAARAAAAIDPDKIRRAEMIVQQMAGAHPGNHYRDFAVHDSEFHDYLASLSGNTLIADSLERLHTHIHIFRFYSHARVTQEAIDEHRQIFDKLKQGDPEGTAAAMRSHIEKSRQRVMSVFD